MRCTIARRAMARGLRGKQSANFLVKLGAGGGDDVAARVGRAALKGGYNPSGLLNDGNQGRYVIGLQAGIDHQINEAGGQQTENIGISARAGQPCAGFYVLSP